MVFDDSGHPNGPQNGSSRDNRPSGRRGAANGRGVTDMPKPEKFTSQGEYVSVAAPIPTGSWITASVFSIERTDLRCPTGYETCARKIQAEIPSLP